ncbi:NADH-quinone oxidoreductase subunit C [Deinococcus ruber]|uniref:NADH-quinone oxidoreductase subunit C n=1 Tax=Deinococcus ruber TaxID=1848197 RepID=A0A918BW19_9DEIO|nr:NADH-quinone oxidoreductase subunit C [Deinococcus ruber]GGQ95166.1 NADH-quinone oxidoreductase subunit C [Deinococcus ruber]
MTTLDPRRDPLSPQFSDWLTSLDVKADDSAEPTALVPADDLIRVARLLKSDGFMLLDSIGLDYSQYVEERPARYCVLHNVFHPTDYRRLFLRVYVPESGEIPSLYQVWKAANYLEREVYDLMGVVFAGHPDMRKVLTPDDLEGHPLRKDFPIGETPTLFRDGRFLDPAAFRAGLSGQSAGLTGWRGALRRGEQSQPLPPVMPEGGPK